MNKSKYAIALMACCIVAVAGCAGKTAGNTAQHTADEAKEITFDADSAYSFVARQCAFGERVPNTDAHSECGDWIASRLRQCGATVTEQRADLKAFDGTLLHTRNIVGEFYPEKKRRVLLVAHWDCRPWADSDPNPDNRRKPVMGANDGASGVGVLLEMARLLKNNEPAVGIDILLVDAEDWGDDNGDNPDSWALGAQHWVRTPHREGYTRPEYAILLDMVGDANATFLREYFSQQYAPDVVNRVWAAANRLGYGNFFVNANGGGITDDHLAINNAGIPCIDIIDQRMDSPTGFCPQWHTTDDTMTHIDRRPLKAVGQTLVNLLLEK